MNIEMVILTWKKEGMKAMGVYSDFETFCSNLRMDEETVNKVRSRYKEITKQINKLYWNSESELNHSIYVGSYGRGTSIHTSDIDIIVELPTSVYHRFNSYLANGQSKLLYDVRESIGERYSQTQIKSDGQVVEVMFSDGIRFEVVPAFKLSHDDSYTYPDTHNGGSWKKTYPKEELEAFRKLNQITNRNFTKLARMIRAWNENCNVGLKGIMIDILCYNFLSTNTYLWDSSFDQMSITFFEWLNKHSPYSTYLTVPGSYTSIWCSIDTKTKSEKAYDRALSALLYKRLGNLDLTRYQWRKIYGTKFPQ